MPTTDTHRNCHCGQAIEVTSPGHCPRCGRAVTTATSHWHATPDIPTKLLVAV